MKGSHDAREGNADLSGHADGPGESAGDREGLSLAEIVVRAVYEVRAHNFEVAVYAGEGRFLGIRTKFVYRFVDTELHWETHARFGTVRPLRPVGVIEEDIAIIDFVGHACRTCGAAMVATGLPAPNAWRHDADTTCDDACPVLQHNDALLRALGDFEK
jgi:hypothetical protein